MEKLPMKDTSKLEMLTGLLLEPSKPSKTKEDVDLAGLSPVLPSLNPSNSWETESSEDSPTNKLPLVTHSLPDVTEDDIIGPYLTWPLLESVPKPLTPIPPEPPDPLELAKEPHLVPLTLSPSEDIPPSLDYPDLWANLTLPPLPSPSMPEDGHLTPAESSPTVELPSITPS